MDEGHTGSGGEIHVISDGRENDLEQRAERISFLQH